MHQTLNINFFTKAGSLACWTDSQHLVSNVGWCTDREAQTQHHAGSLGDETDQVEGRGRLISGTVETGFVQSIRELLIDIDIKRPVTQISHFKERTSAVCFRPPSSHLYMSLTYE